MQEIGISKNWKVRNPKKQEFQKSTKSEKKKI